MAVLCLPIIENRILQSYATSVERDTSVSVGVQGELLTLSIENNLVGNV